VLENPSTYVEYVASTIPEWEFLSALCERTGCGLLLDVNNVFVNSRNFGFDPIDYIDRIPAERVAQLHVAGHLLRPDGLRIDTHGEAVCDEVYALVEHTLRRLGPRPVLLERDNDIPPLPVLLAEVEALGAIWTRVFGSES
jgi:uncharacterized protein (UPF0276 family)